MASTDSIRIIPNYIYFYHLDKFCVLPLYPESITDRMDTSFSATQALSRSAPIYTYNNSGPRTVAINLKLHRDLMNDINKDVSNLKSNVVDFSEDDYVDTLIKYLQSIALPRYQIYNKGSKSVIPPMIAIRFGDEIFIKGVVASGIDVTYEKPILVNNKYAQVSITFSVSEVDPYDADSVVKDGSFRGIFESRFKGGIYKVNSNSVSNPAYTGNEMGMSNNGLIERNVTLHSNTRLGDKNIDITKHKNNYRINWRDDEPLMFQDVVKTM